MITDAFGSFHTRSASASSAIVDGVGNCASVGSGIAWEVVVGNGECILSEHAERIISRMIVVTERVCIRFNEFPFRPLFEHVRYIDATCRSPVSCLHDGKKLYDSLCSCLLLLPDPCSSLYIHHYIVTYLTAWGRVTRLMIPSFDPCNTHHVSVQMLTSDLKFAILYVVTQKHCGDVGKQNPFAWKKVLS